MIPELTNRERDIVRFLCLGMTNREIGTALGISHRTVKNHITAICEKWELHTRTQIIITAFGLGMYDARQCWVDMGKM